MLLKVIRQLWWIAVNTFQFLGGEDTKLPALSYFILRMKTADWIKTLANQ